jgi:glycosyltransferase involved in cell wall biosynthesis
MPSVKSRFGISFVCRDNPLGGPIYQRKRRLAILTAAPLARNPRAFKEAETIARAGFEVVVYGASFDAGERETDQVLADRHSFSFQSVVPVAADGRKPQLLSLWRRMRTRFGVDLNRYLRIENAWQLGPAVVELAKRAREAEADYYIAHLEQGASVGARLRRSGSNVGIDMEDWYSEDLPPEARRSRPLQLLRVLERELLTTGAHATCPSRAMSEALAREFGCPQPTIIYNAFPWSDRESIDGLSKDRNHRRLPSIHWFSQTLGHGRGLEDLIASLPLLEHQAEIHLRGKPVSGFDSWLAGRVPETWRERVMVHGLVSNAELLSRIAEHDIGFAGETPLIRSRDLTVTNKILYYLLAGLAVVASNTAGQREVAVQAPGAVFLYPSSDAPALAASLNRLLGSADTLRQAKGAALAAAERTFCWERQEKSILESIHRALGSPG